MPDDRSRERDIICGQRVLRFQFALPKAKPRLVFFRVCPPAFCIAIAAETLPAAVVPLSRNPFPSGVPFSLGVESSAPLKQMVAAGLGYGLLPFSGIYQEVAAGTLSAALLPWIRADRVLALPRGRPASRATKEAVTALKEVCASLIREGKILTAPSRVRAR
jgi:DNA-binding transcriptional LysR family regulator